VALRRVSYPSPNYSSRGGATVTTIVIHTAEGARTIESLANWFANPANQVSSHTGIDDTPNTIAEYVPRSGKAWTAANANPWSIQTELCAFAAWDSAEWNRHPTMLANCAAWIAEEAAFFGIPITKLSAAQAQNPAARGVCQHIDLGSMGGGHVDCGPAFPLDQVLAMAAGQTTPPKPPPSKEVRMFLARASTDSSHDPNLKKGLAYVVTDGGLVPVATNDDMSNMAKQLGPEVALTGNQLWGFNQNR
jgi:hypothetical protein